MEFKVKTDEKELIFQFIKMSENREKKINQIMEILGENKTFAIEELNNFNYIVKVKNNNVNDLWKIDNYDKCLMVINEIMFNVLELDYFEIIDKYENEKEFKNDNN